MNCGEKAFYYLCKRVGIDLNEEFLIHRVGNLLCTFEDFYDWSLDLGIIGEGIGGVFVGGFEPFIAHLSLFKWEHFVVVIHYGWVVSYMDVDDRIHYLPKFIFNIFYTGCLFHFVAMKRVDDRGGNVV